MLAIAVARIDDTELHAEDMGRHLRPGDRHRLETIRTEKRRHELIAGRWLLRALARQLGLIHLAFDSAEDRAGVVVHGLRVADGRMAASVSHAGAWVACALGWDGAVGIDLEVLRERDFIALANASFPESVAVLAELAPDNRKVQFYVRWTRQEARIKCGTAGTFVTWLRPDEWVLSVCAAAPEPVSPVPMMWDPVSEDFEPLALAKLDAFD